VLYQVEGGRFPRGKHLVISQVNQAQAAQPGGILTALA